MKLWALIRANQKIVLDVVMEFQASSAVSVEDWQPIIGELAQALQLGRPVILKKHADQLSQFRRTVFFPDDFMESVNFDKFEVELFAKEKEHNYSGDN